MDIAYSCRQYQQQRDAHQFVVEVHEVIVRGVLRGILPCGPENLLHVSRVTPSPRRSIHRRNVVQDEWLYRHETERGKDKALVEYNTGESYLYSSGREKSWEKER